MAFKPAADQCEMHSRLHFEWRLGHYLAAEPATLDVARRVTMACGSYLRSRVRNDARSASRRARLTYELLLRVRQPAPLPFALHAGSPWSGRSRNAKELQDVLNGAGNVREFLGSVWLFFSFLMGEDLVGKRLHPDAVNIAHEAGFDAVLLRHWLQQALDHRRQQYQDVTLQDLDPKRDFLRMPWHPVFELNRHSHSLVLHPLCDRVWSLDTRADFLEAGGTFSKREREETSPLGKDRVPWIDPARFTAVNSDNDLVRHAAAHGMPMRTGISRVAMQMLQFARVARVGDHTDMQRAVLGYLLSVRAHSFFEGIMGMTAAQPKAPCSYRDCGILDWTRVASSCGPIPEA